MTIRKHYFRGTGSVHVEIQTREIFIIYTFIHNKIYRSKQFSMNNYARWIREIYVYENK